MSALRTSSILAICGTALATLGLAVPTNAASTVTRTSTSVLYAGHGVGVIATYDPTTGCSEVYTSTNLSAWRNITPLLTTPTGVANGQCLYMWTSAYFASPRVGWLLARNSGSTDTILRHTLNGGRTWIAQPGGSTGSNAGEESISFVNATLGWRQQLGTGSNGNYSLERTINGGATWTTRSTNPHGWCIASHDVFSSTRVGFAFVTPTPATNPTHLWRTSDGGIDWSLMTLPRPSTVPPEAPGLYGTPSFVGREGVVPVDYSVRGRQTVYFYVTHDDGVSWAPATSHSRVVVAGTLHIDRHSAAANPCFGDSSAPVATGDVAVISPANPMIWWLLQPGRKDHGSITVEFLNRGRISSTTLHTLPSTRKVTTLAALSSRSALLTLPIPYGFQSTYVTTNGGLSWTRIHRPELPGTGHAVD